MSTSNNATCVPASVWSPGCDTPDSSEEDILPISIEAVTGVTRYPLPTAVSQAAAVTISGRTISPFGDFSIELTSGEYFLVLSEAAGAGEEILIYIRATIPLAPTAPVVDKSNLALGFIADIRTTDLTDVDNFKTWNFDEVGDNGGARWAATGNSAAADAGKLPTLETGNVYDINGKEFVYSKRVLFKKAFGVKDSDQSENIHIDVTQQLNDMIAFGRLRAPADGLPKGGSNLFFDPRGEIEKTGTLNLIDYFLPIDFNESLIYQQDAVSDVINWEANNAGFHHLHIRWAPSITEEAFFNGKPAAVRISGGQPVDTSSESVFSALNNIWVLGGWDGLKIDSQGVEGGLFWQFEMNKVYVRDHMNRAFNFNTVSQVATTSAMYHCHAGCKVRSKVQNGGQSYLAKQHMEASAPVQPGVTAGWESFWEQEINPILDATRPQWVTNAFYRTMGKGYFINNVQTFSMYKCSMDGGNNEQDGNVIFTNNSVFHIPDDFHLEGHTLSNPNGKSFIIGSDGRVETIYMFDLRLRAGSGNTVYLFGGIVGRNRNFGLAEIRNQKQADLTDGSILGYIDGGRTAVPEDAMYNGLRLGIGMARHLCRALPRNTDMARDWDGDEGNDINDTSLGVVTFSGSVTPTREQSGTLFRTDELVNADVILDPSEMLVGLKYGFFNASVAGTLTYKDTTGFVLIPGSLVLSPGGILLHMSPGDTNPTTPGKTTNLRVDTAARFVASEV